MAGTMDISSSKQKKIRPAPLSLELQTKLENVIDVRLIQQNNVSQSLLNHLDTGAVPEELVLQILGFLFQKWVPSDRNELLKHVNSYLARTDSLRLRCLAQRARWEQYPVKIWVLVPSLVDSDCKWLTRSIRGLEHKICHLQLNIHVRPAYVTPQSQEPYGVDETLAKAMQTLAGFEFPRFNLLRTIVVYIQADYYLNKDDTQGRAERLQWLMSTNMAIDLRHAMEVLRSLKQAGKALAVGLTMTTARDEEARTEWRQLRSASVGEVLDQLCGEGYAGCWV